MCPLQSFAEENFWGDTVDSGMHELQPPSAVQNDSTPELESSAVKTKNTKGSKTVKDIEILGNNVIETSLILQQMKLQKGDVYSRENESYPCQQP